MERALDLTRLRQALGEHLTDSPHRLPTPEQLQGLLTEAEIGVFLRESTLPESLLRTGWYLHGVASSSAAAQLYTPERQRQAFETSALIFDLALSDLARSRKEVLALAFGAQIGYRRAALDPNATAMYLRVESLIVREPPVERHIETLALEAAVALLGFQTATLFRTFGAWEAQLGAVQRLVGLDDLWGTAFGPAQRVVTGCRALLNFLAFGREEELVRARSAFSDVVGTESPGADLDARWVASHLLDFANDSAQSSLWRLLPPDIPPVVRQAFTLASPPILTLWEPQKLLFGSPDAPHQSPLEARRAVVSIPTSSGKTLLAQLLIASHVAADRGRVCYVAPMRSLGREVRGALRTRLRVLAREMGNELPDFGAPRVGAAEPPGIPTIDDLLAGLGANGTVPDVEIMTPERLANLLRHDPQGTLDRFQMFVFDEVHFLAEGRRGFILESVISFLHWRTTSSNHRIILLSAALGNDAQILSWIDPNSAGLPLQSAWRGPRRLHGIFSTRPNWQAGESSAVNSRDWPQRVTYPQEGILRIRPSEGAERTLALTTPVGNLARRYGRDGTARAGAEGPPHSTQQYRMTAHVVRELGGFGSVLVVTSTRALAQDLARALSELLDDDPRARALVDMAEQRLGAAHPLSNVLRKGVAFHHAALPADVLEEIEDGLRGGTLQFLVCTSTLTEGVNLPVRTVVIAETTNESTVPLSPARLINAMGRAGRAGRESEGWIILARFAPEHPSDFDVMNPAAEDLTAASVLGSENALASLAELESATLAGADAAFRAGTSLATDFVAFVWFLLASEEERNVEPDLADLDGALRATLAFTQANEDVRQRWLSVAEATRASYQSSDPNRRRMWARSGTSVRSARQLDELAAVVIQQVLVRRDDGDFLERLSGPEAALDLLAGLGVINALLALPEHERSWSFRTNRRGVSSLIEVDALALLKAWLNGDSIPQIAETFLPAVPAEDWRVEQIVDTTTQHFEHFLSWTIGVLMEIVNGTLFESGLGAVCPELPAYVRYGVSSPLAIRLLLGEVKSRRVAQSIAIEAAADEVDESSLRTWLASMDLSLLRTRFRASSSELGDLLEFARTPRTSLLRDLLENGRTGLTAITSEVDERETDESTAVDLRPVDVDERPQRIGAYRAGGGEAVAYIPTSWLPDVQSILATGIPLLSVLTGHNLEISIAPDG